MAAGRDCETPRLFRRHVVERHDVKEPRRTAIRLNSASHSREALSTGLEKHVDVGRRAEIASDFAGAPVAPAPRSRVLSRALFALPAKPSATSRPGRGSALVGSHRSRCRERSPGQHGAAPIIASRLYLTPSRTGDIAAVSRPDPGSSSHRRVWREPRAPQPDVRAAVFHGKACCRRRVFSTSFASLMDICTSAGRTPPTHFPTQALLHASAR